MRLDSRASEFTRSVLAGLVPDSTDIAEIKERIQKTASGYTPRDINTLSRKPDNGLLTAKSISESTFDRNDLIRAARVALVNAYKTAGQKDVQLALLDVEKSDKLYRVKFAANRASQRAEVTVNLSSPTDIVPIDVPKFAELNRQQLTPTRFFVASEEFGPYTNGAALKIALNKQRIICAEAKPHHYVLGLLPEDDRDLKAIASAVLASGTKSIAPRVKTASEEKPILFTANEDLYLELDKIATRVAEADRDLAKTASSPETRNSLYASIKTSLQTCKAAAAEYATNVGDHANNMLERNRSHVLREANGHFSSWIKLAQDIYRNSSAIFATQPLVQSSRVLADRIQSFQNDGYESLYQQPNHTAERIEASTQTKFADESSALYQISGQLSALQSLIEKRAEDVRSEDHFPNFHSVEPYRISNTLNIYSKNVKTAGEYDDEGQITEGGDNPNELDVKNKNQRHAVLEAFKGAGSTVDEVCNKLKMSKLEVMQHLQACRAQGYTVVDADKEKNKNGYHVCEPGVDIRGRKIKLLPFGKTSKTADVIRNKPHCRVCDAELHIESNQDGSMRAFCPKCKSKELTDLQKNAAKRIKRLFRGDLASEQAMKPPTPGKRRIITKNDDGSTEVSEIDENSPEAQKTATIKKGGRVHR